MLDIHLPTYEEEKHNINVVYTLTYEVIAGCFPQRQLGRRPIVDEQIRKIVIVRTIVGVVAVVVSVLGFLVEQMRDTGTGTSASVVRVVDEVHILIVWIIVLPRKLEHTCGTGVRLKERRRIPIGVREPG